jgi:hypothetical protein
LTYLAYVLTDRSKDQRGNTIQESDGTPIPCATAQAGIPVDIPERYEKE